jgi:hypothetical protein
VGGLWKETAREQRNWAPGEGKGRALDLSRWAGSQIWPSHALSSPTRSWIGPVVVRAKSKSRMDFFPLSRWAFSLGSYLPNLLVAH